MNRILKIIIMSVAIVIGMKINAFAIDVNIDDVKISFDAEPQIVNNHTMVPMRGIFEKFGAEVIWDGETQQITAKKDLIDIHFTIDDDVYYINGIPFDMDVAPYINKGRTMLPLRVISESFGADVEWDGEAQLVNITSTDMEELELKDDDLNFNYYGETENGMASGYGVAVNIKEYEDGAYYIKTVIGQFDHDTLIDGSILYSDGDIYKGETDGYVKNGFGTYYWSDGDRFEGQWSNNDRNGQGTYYWSNGVCDEGVWTGNNRDGIYKRYFIDGNYAIREYADGSLMDTTYYNKDGSLKDGSDEIHFYDNEYYIGSFSEGKINGQGTYYYEDGSRYEAEWENDHRNGIGRYYFKDGKYAYAEWNDGSYIPESVVYCGPDNMQLQGEFVLTTIDGAIYEGKINKGKITGYGKMTYNNGYYEGELLNGLKHGTGTYNWTNGDSYKGKWKYGNRDGNGTYYFANGTYREDLYDNGTYAGTYQELTYIDGYYRGLCYNGYPNGYGTFYYNNGDRYDGEWINGLADGEGTYYYSNGDYKICLYINGTCISEVRYHADGTRYGASN